MGNDLDLAIALLGDDDVVAQVVGAALDLDAVLEELLKGRDVEDLVVGGLGSVDDVLQARLVSSQTLDRARRHGQEAQLRFRTYLLGLLLDLASLLL